MRFAISLLGMVLSLGSLSAGEKTRTNVLTSDEVRDGWLMLCDGETTFGWRIDGEARIENGVLILGGKKETRATCTTAFSFCELRFEFDMKQRKGELRLNSFVQKIDEWSFRDGEKWRQVVAWVKPGEIVYTIPGEGQNSSKPKIDGPTDIIFVVAAGDTLAVRDIRLKPLQMTSLFNGKDLSGWRVFLGKKSRFAVKDNAINVQDGPGDLQSNGKYGDFVLQLECISNGKHLNSGLFFRCKPSEYQNGYEVQVRNQFTPEPTQEYVLEEYDPQTHMLAGKKKIKSTAVDFGTGAIYRRVPARKEMSKDGAWFTLTLAARANHFATWVNGVQVTDWTDYRSASDNPRTGYRKEAGHISFQGHDPTTDLSFRNIRIGELP